MQSRARALLLALAVLTAMGLAAVPAAAQACDTATAEQPATDTPPVCPVEDGAGGVPEAGTGGEGAGGGGGGGGDAVAANRVDAGGGGAAGTGMPATPIAIAAASALAGAALFAASRRRA